MKKLLFLIITLLVVTVLFQQVVISEQSENVRMLEGMLHEERQHYSDKIDEYDSLMDAYYDSVMTQWTFKTKY
jgi:hypothetical protein